MQILFKSKTFEVKLEDFFIKRFVYVYIFIYYREAEQMKLLYETINQASLLDSNRLYQCGTREFSRLEPRRPNPLDRYSLPE